MAGVGTLEVGALIPGVTHPHRVPCHGELAEEDAAAMLELFGDPVANHGSGDYLGSLFVNQGSSDYFGS